MEERSVTRIISINDGGQRSRAGQTASSSGGGSVYMIYTLQFKEEEEEEAKPRARANACSHRKPPRGELNARERS